MSASTKGVLRTGEPGHEWIKAKSYPIPRALLTERQVLAGTRPVYRSGPLVCGREGCGEFWPGTGPCRAETGGAA